VLLHRFFLLLSVVMLSWSLFQRDMAANEQRRRFKAHWEKSDRDDDAINLSFRCQTSHHRITPYEQMLRCYYYHSDNNTYHPSSQLAYRRQIDKVTNGRSQLNCQNSGLQCFKAWWRLDFSQMQHQTLCENFRHDAAVWCSCDIKSLNILSNITFIHRITPNYIRKKLI